MAKPTLATALTFAELLAPIAKQNLPTIAPSSAAFFPWLVQHASPELGKWNDYFAKQSVVAGYRNGLFAAWTVAFSDTLKVADDGCRAARIRSLFLGASPILEDAEELWLASWAPTADGTSQVWWSHQDERELECVAESLANFAVRQYSEDSYFNNPDHAKYVKIPPELAALVTEQQPTALAEKLGPADLQRRTDWIVALFFPEGDWYGIGDGSANMPAFAEYRADLDRSQNSLVRHWPHHQAYWLMHHLVLGNQAALRELIPLIELAYAPSAELVRVASCVLAGGDDLPDWWDTTRSTKLCAKLQTARPDVFE